MKENEELTEPRKEKIDTRSLRDLAIYLSGLKDGKGDLYPLGLCKLGNLWDAIKYLEGDTRFTAERDEMVEKSRTERLLEQNAIYNKNSENPMLIIDGSQCRKINNEEYKLLRETIVDLGKKLGVLPSFRYFFVDTSK